MANFAISVKLYYFMGTLVGAACQDTPRKSRQAESILACHMSLWIKFTRERVQKKLLQDSNNMGWFFLAVNGAYKKANSSTKWHYLRNKLRKLHLWYKFFNHTISKKGK